MVSREAGKWDDLLRALREYLWDLCENSLTKTPHSSPPETAPVILHSVADLFYGESNL